jgi:hypothetical protein
VFKLPPVVDTGVQHIIHHSEPFRLLLAPPPSCASLRVADGAEARSPSLSKNAPITATTQESWRSLCAHGVLGMMR